MRYIKKYRIVIVVSAIFFILLGGTRPVFALRAEVSPSEISPGDAFVIKVEGNGFSAAPKAALRGNSLAFTACGVGCFETVDAVGLDMRSGSYPVTVSVGHVRVTVQITVKPTVFPTIRLTLPEKEVILSPRDLARAKREEGLLQSIWQKETPRLWKGDFILPLPTEISTPFGYRRVLNGKRISIHKGIDMRGHEGEKIKACNRGRVVLAKKLFFGGNTLVIDHGMGIYSVYMHLSKFEVQPGDVVSKGQTIGLVGSTGRATGPHLHFSMRVHDISANPVSLTRLPL